MFKKLKQFILEPISQIKKRYIPLMLIYAAYAASGVTSVSESFFVKKSLTLSAEQIIQISIYCTIPWTIKFIFGTAVDTIKIFGSQRKSYIIIGSILMLASYILLAAISGDYQWIEHIASKNTLYIISSIALSTAFCIQNVTSETMSTEVVDRHDKNGNLLDKEIINQELTLVQYLCRLSFAFSGFVVAGLGGLLASNYSYSTVFLVATLIPVIVLIGLKFIHLDEMPSHKPDWKILIGGLVFSIFCIFMGIENYEFSQEIVFSVSLALVIGLLVFTCKGLDYESKKTIALSSLIIFIYQGTPSSGPGVNWWMQDSLGFTEGFYGALNQLSAAFSLLGMWMLAKWIKNKQVSYVLLFLTGLQFILSLPTIGLSFGLHHWTEAHLGFGARTITMIDVAAASPFEIITNVSLLALVASHAPKGKAGIFFALLTSLMNLSLNFSGLMTKYLYHFYPIERGMYGNIQEVLIIPTAISLIVPSLAILILMNPFKKIKGS